VVQRPIVKEERSPPFHAFTNSADNPNQDETLRETVKGDF
jgi:hypothetical protein